MQLTRVLSHALATALLIMPAASACDRLWLADNGELWLTNDRESRLLLSDAHGINHPRWSPDGQHIAYAHPFRFPESGPQSEVVVVTREGRPVATLSIPAESAVNEVLTVGWRDAQRVSVEGHVNPSTSKYLEWDVRSGRLVDEKAGSWFAVSADGRFVAQRANVPHGAPPPYDSAMLLINEKRVYPATGDESYHRFVGPLAWSPDSSRVALLDRSEKSPMQVTVVKTTGEIALRVPVPDAMTPKELTWSGPNTLDLRNNGEVWRVEMSTGEIEQVRNVREPQVEAPVSLRQSVGADVGLHLEDALCGE